MLVMMHSLPLPALLGLLCLSDAMRVKHKHKRANTIRVGTLGGHHPGNWSGACNQTSYNSLERGICNLNIYEEAAKTAQLNGVDFLVLPEYGLIGEAATHTEAAPAVGDHPCALQGSAHAQVSRLSCIAQRYSVALAANIITSPLSGYKFITEIVYDKWGIVKAVYDKNRLFFGEGSWATSGPFNPTVFELFGQKWALCICYEGLDPFAGWIQFLSFRQQGADHVLWSVGNTAIGEVLLRSARIIAEFVDMNVFASMNEAMLWGDTTALIGRSGEDLPRTSADLDQDALSNFGYGARAYINYATVSPPVHRRLQSLPSRAPSSTCGAVFTLLVLMLRVAPAM